MWLDDKKTKIQFAKENEKIISCCCEEKFDFSFIIYQYPHIHHAKGMLIVNKWRKIQWHSEDSLMAQQHPMLTCLVTNFHLQGRNYFHLHNKRSKHWNFIISQPCRRQVSAVGVSQLNCPIRNSISYHAL